MNQHKVVRGDSLWRLAHRYLGNGTRWPLIRDFHNANYLRFGSQPGMFPIVDENLIYVGQTVLVPVRTSEMPQGNGTKSDGDKPAVPIDLKVNYTIGKDTPPLTYIRHTPDFTITTQMTGNFTIELLSPDRYYHNLELAFGKDPVQVKSKLKQVYDPAVCALTAEPEMVFDSGQVKIKAPIFPEHSAGFYSIRVQIDGATHMSGSLVIQPISGKVTAGGRDFQYVADIELKADMEWHTMPREKPTEQVRTEATQEQPALAPSTSRFNWEKMKNDADEVITTVGLIIIGMLLVASGAGRSMTGQTTSTMPFTHIVDPRNPRYLSFKNKINV